MKILQNLVLAAFLITTYACKADPSKEIGLSANISSEKPVKQHYINRYVELIFFIWPYLDFCTL